MAASVDLDKLQMADLRLTTRESCRDVAGSAGGLVRAFHALIKARQASTVLVVRALPSLRNRAKPGPPRALRHRSQAGTVPALAHLGRWLTNPCTYSHQPAYVYVQAASKLSSHEKVPAL